MAAPSVDDLRDQGRAMMLVRRPDLEGDDGDVSIMVLDEMVSMADVELATHASDVGSTYLAGARDDKLTQLADDHFNTQRDLEIGSIGTVTFTRTPAGPVTIPAGTRVATTIQPDGSFQEFTTDIDLVFAAEAFLSVAASSSSTGLQANVSDGTIDRILDTLPQSFVVSNPDRFVGGAPEQDDDSLVQEVQSREATLRRGTKAAIEFGAKQVPSVKTATAIVSGTTPTVYVSDADGNSNSQMVSDVDVELENWQAFGVDVVPVGAILLSQAIDVSLVVRSGIDVNALADRIRQQIVSDVNRLGAGETLFRGLIETAIRNVDRDAIVTVTFNTPLADIAPASDELIRTNLGIVSVS
jgi:hypothetical protein